METFTLPKDFVENAHFAADRQTSLDALDPSLLDAPLRDIVAAFAALSHAFTLQCCYGHFLGAADDDEHSLASIPEGQTDPVRYRIAYVAVCLEASARGRGLRDALAAIPAIAPGAIQFGCADWFWARWPNSYVLQVEPEAHRLHDEALLEAVEALRIEETRDRFFTALRALLAAEV